MEVFATFLLGESSSADDVIEIDSRETFLWRMNAAMYRWQAVQDVLFRISLAWCPGSSSGHPHHGMLLDNRRSCRSLSDVAPKSPIRLRTLFCFCNVSSEVQYRFFSVLVVRIVDEPTTDQDDLSKPRASQQLLQECFAAFAGVSSDKRDQISGHLNERQAKHEGSHVIDSSTRP